MKVGIKEFNVAMEVKKNNGIEFEVYDNDGTFRGDCYLTKTGLIWCEGKTSRANEAIDLHPSDQKHCTRALVSGLCSALFIGAPTRSSPRLVVEIVQGYSFPD